MKKVLTIALLMVLLFLTACSEDDVYITTNDSDQTVEEDTTIYRKHETSLSIALLGNPQERQYDEIVQAVQEYAEFEGRLYRVYDTSKDDPYEPIISLEAIDEVINDGAKIIILTSGFYHSEAAFEAQTKYPDIQFVLLGGEPKENCFWSQPYTAANTITTKPANVYSGFFAGYSAVYEGYHNLGFFNSNARFNSTSSGAGFLAGAYYAASQLDVDIIISEKGYRNFDNPSFLLEGLYADIAYDLGAELIYVFGNDSTSRITDLANEKDRKVILAPNSYNNDSEAVLSFLETDRASTVVSIIDDYFKGGFEGGQSILDDYFKGGIEGGKSIYEDYTIDFTHYSTFNETQFENMKNMINEGAIVVPDDYASLLEFVESLGITLPLYMDEWFINGVHTIESLY